jgi:hypothetical protein
MGQKKRRDSTPRGVLNRVGILANWPPDWIRLPFIEVFRTGADLCFALAVMF